MTWRQQEFPDLARHLAGRPGHEAVRTGVVEILRRGFGAAVEQLTHEVRLPEIRGRVDTVFGATVFEYKSDLRREEGDVLARLPDYLRERERQTGRRYLGVATDGAEWRAYELREGALHEVGRRLPLDANNPDALLGWLEPALADRDDLAPEPAAVQGALGRHSFVFGYASNALARLWDTYRTHPEAALKRDLWDALLREVYGQPVGDDALFLQHTYLTVVAKTIAAAVLDVPADDAEAVLSGKLLAENGIHGAVESDFFDWVLLDPGGADLVLRLARQAARFRLRDVQADVLKALYESLIDPAQRHELGEYYTPDWLAAKLVARAVDRPLDQRVLDPACGSGTFLFHAIRRLRAAAQGAGLPAAERVRRCAANVRGLDVHPVAVIIARVTWLLALGEDVQAREGDVNVPVYLGDAMQWNLRRVANVLDVEVPVPGEAPLRVPAGFAESQERLDAGIRELDEGARGGRSVEAVERGLRRIAGASEADVAELGRTYAHLRALFDAGRDGIWPFVLRNLVRPVWLSRPDQRADVLVGNPPWVAYRNLSAEMKPRLRGALEDLGLWVGGKLATQQDLCALFWARGAERYLAPGGTVAMVLPYAVMNAPAFAGLRRGAFRTAKVGITEGWALEAVRPLFGAQSGSGTTSTCVLFGRRGETAVLPAAAVRLAGTLPRRDATEAEADRALRRETVPWPRARTLAVGSPYRARFKQGATIVPRRFFLVTREAAGRLGASAAAPLVRGRTGPLDKRPWNGVEPPRGPVEAKFLRPVLLGESIAPFRLLTPALGVVPLERRDVLDSAVAADRGYRHLAAWLRDVEAKWKDHSNTRADGAPRMTLRQRLDHMRTLSSQDGSARTRIVYAASGTLLSACVLEDPSIVVEHKAYWATARSVGEARYLCAVINSGTVLRLVAPLQPRGWRDARDFDNLVWELRIPEYDRALLLHRSLAAAAARAEAVAAAVPLREGADFRVHRRAIRDAITAAGLAARLDRLVALLLDRPAAPTETAGSATEHENGDQISRNGTV